MFKDYYLILGIGNDASPNEIEKAFKDANEKYSANEVDSQNLQEVQEAFAILSNQETKVLYDKELAAYNESDDFEHYEIKDLQLANSIKSLQTNIDEVQKPSSGCGSKLGKGCLWAIVVIIFFLLQTCFSAIMKQRGRNAVRNSYSYVMQQDK